MANQILIKRGTGTSALANGELGYNTSTNTLYIGNNGNKAIGGSGAFLPLSGGTISGTLILQNAQKNGHIKLYGSTEGGNFQIQGPNNKYYWEMDALNNNQLRLYCHDMDNNENYGFWMWNSDKSTTFPGKIQASSAHFTSAGDALEDSHGDVALRLGTENGWHLDLDGNEILAKDNATTMGTLHLQGLKITEGGNITTGTWNGSVITVAKGGTGQDMSATPANALIRMSSAGTFWYTASANGAVYATSANGAITFGTLPVAQGGTGATTANGACTNLGAVKKSGDTMTGKLRMIGGSVELVNSVWPTFGFASDATGEIVGTGSLYQAQSSRRIGFQQIAENSAQPEDYLLPTPSQQEERKWYNILTSKNAVTVAQGGTGATTAAQARKNLAVPYYAKYDAGNLQTGAGNVSAWITYYGDDGTNYNQMDLGKTATAFSKPVNVASGGTGATTAAGARANLQVPHLDGKVINLGSNQVGIGLRTDNGGWWQFWNWGNATDGYYAAFAPTLNGKQNLGTTSMYINNVYANNYIGSTLSLSSTADASETANNNVCIRTGSATGQHLDIDNNEIISKTDASTMGDLYLQGMRIAASGKITSGTWNGSAIGVAYGGTGKTTLTSGQALIGNGTGAITTRAITDNTSVGALISSSSWTSNNSNLVTLNTLAFWNGAHAGNYSNLSKLATVTTGTWQATAIAVAYGGTGATSASGACTNLGAVKKSGDTMTGQLTTTRMVASAEWPTYAFYHTTSAREYAFIQTATDGSFAFYTYGNGESKWTGYTLPGPDTGLTANKKYNILTTKSAVTVAQGGTGATNMLGAQANLLTTDSSKITATTNLNTILQTGRFKMEGNASTTYNWPANASGARCLIIQEGALNNNTYGYWKQTAHMLGQHRTYSRNYHWDHWMEWKMDYNEETLVYSTSQPSNGYKGRIWLKPI